MEIAKTPEIIYEDNHLLVVVKPRGIAVQKNETDSTDDLQSILKSYLKKKYDKPGNVFLGIVHRLDQPVGGVMVFAKTSKAASRLSDQIRQNIWKKCYLAVVDGIPKQKSGILEDYLVKNEATNEVFVSKKENPKAKFARLFYETLESKNGKSLLKITLETGRAHQIRVQLSSRGLPIVNDHKYNKNSKNISDIALWAYSLEIEHPVTKEKLVFSKEMPENIGI
ncbi:RluA family pseudouridine synthase [bacterium]|nr:RluA family pseudouridine synthase [bacterium]MBP5591035.1 RluA family pseudouridine synthase [bacterium]